MKLFSSYSLSGKSLHNRIVMAPMTRARSTQPGNIPNSLMARYYAQRASAGLIITEASQISQQGQGYSFTPGIHSAEQVDGWRKVTDAVHAEAGVIYLQLWHVGRMSHPDFHQGALPVAPSAINPDAKIWMADENGAGGMVPCPTPRALEAEEIQGVVEDYRQAARNAMEAGFDGVEIHAANGYLIDQFLRTTSNTRSDAYGGSRDNRVRFLIEVAEAVANEVGAEKVGVRLAPFITARGMNCPDVIPTILHAATQLQQLGIGYIHLVEADWDDAPEIPSDFRLALRQVYQGTLIVAGRYDKERASQMIDAGLSDLVAFGRPFIANPDLPMRLHHCLPLASFQSDSLFGGDAEGYTTYPAYSTT
ncbi:alkene reductase [Vreelandella venusta]|uniref:alkene reductase n=1 Tax=Vreelandella venusta TaxID=44935 RepID=UPI004044148D